MYDNLFKGFDNSFMLGIQHHSAMQHIYNQEKAQELISLSTGFAIPRANILYVQRRGEKMRVYFKQSPESHTPWLELRAPDMFEFWEHYTGQILADDTRPDAQQALARARNVNSQGTLADYEIMKAMGK